MDDEVCDECGAKLVDRWLDSGSGIIVCPNCGVCYGVFDGMIEIVDVAEEIIFEPDDDNPAPDPGREAGG